MRPHPMQSVGGQKASPGRDLEMESSAFVTWIHHRPIDIRQLTGLTRNPTFIAMTFCVPLRHGLVMRLGIGFGVELADPDVFPPVVGASWLDRIGTSHESMEASTALDLGRMGLGHDAPAFESITTKG